jgi:membrane-associated phospholipid phosphatase
MTARREKSLVAGLFAIAMLPIFIGIARVTSAHSLPPPWWLSTRLDAAIPVVPAAVWVYASWYPAAFTILMVDRRRFRAGCLAVAIAFLVCSAGHLLWPVSISRPSLDPHRGLSVSALRLLYAVDPPVSLFPSFHAAMALILVWLCVGSQRLHALAVIWMASICVSCVLTKQHYVLDVLGGLLLGAGAVACASNVRWESELCFTMAELTAGDLSGARSPGSHDRVCADHSAPIPCP